jgi:integrase
VIDETIFKMENFRNRLMQELMVRGVMRIGEVLKLRSGDVDDRKLYIDSPKSGRQPEVVLVSKKVAELLMDYIRSRGILSADHIFSMGYTGTRAIVKKASRAVGIDLCPHVLRRHEATYASLVGAPLEAVSKIPIGAYKEPVTLCSSGGYRARAQGRLQRGFPAASPSA